MTNSSYIKIELAPVAVLPPIEQNVIAVTPDFRCLACVDNNGQWYSAYTNEPLPQVTAWMPIG